MKRNYLLLAICLLSAKLMWSQIFMCADPAAWNYDPDAETDPADSTYCLYFEDCQEGTVQRYLEVYGGYVFLGTEFHVISTDLQDTLASYIYSDWGWGGTGFDRNVWSVCLDPDECYFLDIRLPEPLTYFGLFIWAHSEYPLDFYGQFSVPSVDVPTDHYRVYFAAEPADPCGFVGCTDPLAENYNPSATYNFGCIYCQESGVKVSAEFTFNGNTPWQILDDDGIVASGSFNQNSVQQIELTCLDTGCYEFRIYGDDYHFNEISLYTYEDSLLTTMTLTEDSEAIFPFGIGVENCGDPNAIYGCTNPLGQNYDPLATIDDGSCDLQNDQCGITLDAYLDTIQQQLVIDPDFFATDYPIAILWDMGDGTPLFQEGLGDIFLYDTIGVYEVCATLYSWQFFEYLPLCYAKSCIEIDAFEFGFSGGFPVFLNDGTASTEDEYKVKQVQLYPNPAVDRVSVKGISGSIENISIFALDGTKVAGKVNFASSADNLTIDVSTLGSGVYLVVFESSETNFVGRLLKAE